MPAPEENTTPGGGASWIARMLALPNDDRRKTLFVAVALCLVCSIVVSAAAVLLKPLQVANQQLDIRLNILAAAGLLEEGVDIDQAFERIEAKVVDLATGEYTEEINAATYDARKAARDPAMSKAVPAEQDIARIKSKANYATVYLVKDGEQIKTVVLPVHGYGLWSTMYGFIALESDTRKIVGLKFYEQGETAGLGAEVDNPDWLAQWPGKIALDDQGKPVITVAKAAASGDSQVDGLAGATLTSRGVSNLLQYWLGEQGFGTYLAQLRSEGGNRG